MRKKYPGKVSLNARANPRSSSNDAIDVKRFAKVFNSLNEKGVLTTYSSKGIVKQNLRNTGFSIKRLKGPLGKRHVLRAQKLI